MPDAVGIAGLAIAIFDQILKLGERTHQLISDIRAFDEDTRKLQDRLSAENNRNSLLRALLFNQSNIYNTRTLFESFPESIQEEVQLELGESETVISEAIKILEKKYGKSVAAKPSPKSVTASNTTNTYFSHTTNSWFASSTTPIQLISWSMKGKKRVESVVRNFEVCNKKIQEKIKLCSLALQSGIDLKGHLERLQTDPAAKQLGFDVDAKLLVHMVQKEPTATTQTKPQTYKNIKAFENEVMDLFRLNESFSTATWEGKTILLEERCYQTAPNWKDAQKLDPRIEKQIEMLAELLQHPRETDFRIPQCLWWTHNPEKRELQIAFGMDQGLNQSAISLNQLLGFDLKLSLNKKFALVYSLARCLSQFQLVGWVHESIRSDNVLFWATTQATEDLRISGGKLDYHQPWVLGFEFSRPEGHRSQRSSEGFRIEHEIYKHPDRQGEFLKQFTKIHDIYSLGIVLLEIGLWETALVIAGTHIGDGRNPKKTAAWYIKAAERRLESRMGERYKNVVLRCLKGDFGIDPRMDTQGELKLQQAFRRDVVDVLKLTLNGL